MTILQFVTDDYGLSAAIALAAPEDAAAATGPLFLAGNVEDGQSTETMAGDIGNGFGHRTVSAVRGQVAGPVLSTPARCAA